MPIVAAMICVSLYIEPQSCFSAFLIAKQSCFFFNRLNAVYNSVLVFTISGPSMFLTAKISEPGEGENPCETWSCTDKIENGILVFLKQ